MSQQNQTTLTHALRDGQLEHVVVVRSQPVQSHSTLKAAICALALAMALTGCQTMRDHPRVTAFIATSVVLSAYSLSQRHGHREEDFPMSTPLIYPGVKPVNCQELDCK